MLRGSSDIRGTDGASYFSRVADNQTGRSAGRIGGVGYPNRPVFTFVKNLFARALSFFCPCVRPKSAGSELRRGEASSTRRTDKLNQKNQGITEQAAFQPAGTKLRGYLGADSITNDSQQGSQCQVGTRVLRGTAKPLGAFPKQSQYARDLEGASTFTDAIGDKFVDDFNDQEISIRCWLVPHQRC
jgi:hypothetical protein